MWSWSALIGSPGSWLAVGFLAWLILCSLAAYRISRYAVLDRQGVRLTLSFFRGRVELETDPSGAAGTEHPEGVGDVLAQRRDPAAS